MSNDAPIHECESEIDHYTRHYVPYSLRRVCGFFNVPQIYYMCKGLWDEAYGLSSLSEKKPVNNLICCETGLMWMVKRATSLFNSILKQCWKTSCMFFVARFFCTLVEVSLFASDFLWSRKHCIKLLRNLSLHNADKLRVIQAKYSFRFLVILPWLFEFPILTVFTSSGEEPFRWRVYDSVSGF